jgi:recombination protein RecR
VRTSPPIERLVAALKRLPGIGEKSATRLAFFLLGAPDALVQELASAVARLKQEIVLCEECFDLTDTSPCAICRDPKRDASIVCVVEDPADLAAIHRSGRFQGRYHVLGGALSPIDGVGPGELRITELEERVRQLRPLGVKLTRIAYGMPLGGDLEYADHVTIGLSMEHRRSID